ncbi:MAG TPA: copper amine oxidase N-terminal domain-containing protein, partial [Clostridia bacterium]|nr:copper amine oxidase N-terminal domain-containing protein [Clostridia bacterium]
PMTYTAVGSLVSVDVGVAVPAGGSVSLVMPLEVGLVNPLQQGPVSIGIRTSKDTTTAVATGQIVPPSVGSASATFSTLAVGANPSLQLSFMTSQAGALSAGLDTITIAFAQPFVVGKDILPASINVNGVPAAQYAVQGQELQIVVPEAVAADSAVTVAVSEQAALASPTNPCSASLQLETSRDLTAVSVGPFVFREAMPVVCSMTPSRPTGQNGWYVGTPPAISLDPGVGRTVWYRFDDTPFALYTGTAVVAPEGIHTLSFYGVDADGVTWEPVQQEVKVDTVKPSMTLDNAGEIHGVADGFIELTGRISEPVEVLQYNSVPAEVRSDLSFTVRLPAAQQAGMLGAYARDLAGNVTTSISSLRIDKTAPRITMLSPNTPEVSVSSDILHVRCTIDESGEVSVDGKEAVFDGSAWTLDVQLQEGTKSVVVEARDAVGNQSQVTLTVTYRLMTDIVLTVGKSVASVGDRTVDMGVAPIIHQSSTMVPLRFVSEILGATVDWSPAMQIVTLTLGRRVIQLQIVSLMALVDSSVVTLTAAPMLSDGHTLVPLRFISETLGATVAWDAVLKTVTVVLAR